MLSSGHGWGHAFAGVRVGGGSPWAAAELRGAVRAVPLAIPGGRRPLSHAASEPEAPLGAALFTSFGRVVLPQGSPDPDPVVTIAPENCDHRAAGAVFARCAFLSGVRKTLGSETATDRGRGYGQSLRGVRLSIGNRTRFPILRRRGSGSFRTSIRILAVKTKHVSASAARTFSLPVR